MRAYASFACEGTPQGAIGRLVLSHPVPSFLVLLPLSCGWFLSSTLPLISHPDDCEFGESRTLVRHNVWPVHDIL